MKRTVIFGLIIFIFVLLAGVPGVSAAKKRLRRTANPKGNGIAFSQARLSRATNSIIITFLNLNQVRRIDYVLSYGAGGIQQGVVGSLVSGGQTTDSRDLYFGTCSRGVCTPHSNITNATLTVTAGLTSGTTYVKRYIIKV